MPARRQAAVIGANHRNNLIARSRMTRTPHMLCAVFVALSVAPSFADDGFMAIHLANQKSGSPIAEYWRGLSAPRAVLPADGFVAIHMANQKSGSPVANFWLVESQANFPRLD